MISCDAAAGIGCGVEWFRDALGGRMKFVEKSCRWVVALVIAGGAAASSGQDVTVEQDPKVLRFVERSIPYYPDSTFKVLADQRHQTPSGSYRVVRVERTCSNKVLTGEPSVVIDEVTGIAYQGGVGRLPFKQSGAAPRTLRPFVEGFLPEVLKQNMSLKVRVSWDEPEGVRSGAIIPFSLVVDTGYGEFVRPAAVSSDGELLVLGGGMDYDSDPVAVRRALFSDSEFVIWDTSGGGEIAVEVVEFSDLECPACRVKWPLVRKALEAHGGAVLHGMVSFPLTSIHPWAFRASSASWCVAEQDPEQLIPFKELFYELQRDMAVSLVTPTSKDFVAGHGLDEAAFASCYLKGRSLKAVHEQLALGNRVGVGATPTYFINGWMVQMPGDEWFPDLVNRLVRGEEP
jgi:protein-disulfide isomerase